MGLSMAFFGCIHVWQSWEYRPDGVLQQMVAFVLHSDFGVDHLAGREQPCFAERMDH